MVERTEAAQDRFEVLRGQAINAYCQLEQAQLHVLARLLDVDLLKASIVMAVMHSALARRALITNLVEQFCDDKTIGTFKKLSKQIETIDIARNKLIHWMEVIELEPDETFDLETNIYLTEHPKLAGDRKFFAQDIVSFTQTAFVLSRDLFQIELSLKDPQHPAG